jgi:polar amino acid transport system substrate-binding protein
MQVNRSASSRGHRMRLAPRAIAAWFTVVALAAAAAPLASAATLDRIRQTGQIRLGYLADARPFTFLNESGAPDGYAATLCQQLAGQLKTQLALPDLKVEWSPVTIESRLGMVQRGEVDLLCTPLSATLSNREQVSFSIPIFAAGNRAVVRADAPAALRDALGETPSTKPVWRGSPAAKVLEKTTFSVVPGTSTEKWLESRRASLQIDAKIAPATDYRTALQQLLDRKVDVFFGERTAVLGAMDDSMRKNLVVLDRLFTHEPVAFALARDNDDFRLAVDRALSKVNTSPDFPALYTKWFGAFDERTHLFSQWTTPAE